PAREPSGRVTSTAPTRASVIARAACITVAVSGSVSSFWPAMRSPTLMQPTSSGTRIPFAGRAGNRSAGGRLRASPAAAPMPAEPQEGIDVVHRRRGQGEGDAPGDAGRRNEAGEEGDHRRVHEQAGDAQDDP